MKFTFYQNVKARNAYLLTREMYEKWIDSDFVKGLCARTVSERDDKVRSQLKAELPVITWQSMFAGARKSAEAIPSGLFMLDIDHVEALMGDILAKIKGREKELGIYIVHFTPSGNGLRVVAKCYADCNSIAECQSKLACELGLEKYDAVCKDFARCSFMCAKEMHVYYDPAVFTDEPIVTYSNGEYSAAVPVRKNEPVAEDVKEQREGLFGEQNEFQGLPLSDICKQWLLDNGGEPEEGERNSVLYKLATRLRYICDFNERTMLRVMPRYGLEEAEMRQLIHSAVGSVRAASMPQDMAASVRSLSLIKAGVNATDFDDDDIQSVATPSFPPVIREWYAVAPDDFKIATVLCQLPVLGTLGSRLRAKYLDGEMHSPSFQVSLEAPQASGKSFVRRIIDYDMRELRAHDETEREKEREYEKKLKEISMTKTKVTIKNKEEIIGARPETIIRYVPPTMSITKMLIRMNNAQGLHLFATCDEIDTVYKAFKRAISSYSDALRNAFDNADYGQDYASENSFSGIVKLYYNTLFCGTPAAMRRFYPDLEDGLVSRVLFVTLEDQFGRPMPVWRQFTDKEKFSVDIGLQRLNEVSLSGDEVQPEHIMRMDFVNTKLAEWLQHQQAYAVRVNDRTRDIFCRRSAVVGFRAAMLCWFLWGEKNTPTVRKNVCDFAIWVAHNMLTQHLLRFKVNDVGSNTFPCQKAYELLRDEFTKEDAYVMLKKSGYKTEVRDVLYRWRLLGVVMRRDKHSYSKVKK